MFYTTKNILNELCTLDVFQISGGLLISKKQLHFLEQLHLIENTNQNGFLRFGKSECAKLIAQDVSFRDNLQITRRGLSVATLTLCINVSFYF
jgi:hypothetical protein